MNEKHRYNYSSSYRERESNQKIYKSSNSLRLPQNDSKFKENSLVKIRNPEYSISSSSNQSNDKVNYILAKYSKFQFEECEIQELYANFKEIEKADETMIDVRINKKII